jgi:hypothetical protein
MSNEAKIKNKFVSPYPTDPVKIDRLKFFYWKFAVTFFFSFRWKFCILDVFCQKIDIFALLSTSLSSKKKKKPTYLPTSKLVGGVSGNRNIFNCGLLVRILRIFPSKINFLRFKQIFCLWILILLRKYCIFSLSVVIFDWLIVVFKIYSNIFSYSESPLIHLYQFSWFLQSALIHGFLNS